MNGQREARVGDGEARVLPEHLHLAVAQRAEEHRLDDLAQQDGHAEEQVAEHEHRGLGRDEEDHRRVELHPRLPRVQHGAHGGQQRQQDVHRHARRHAAGHGGGAEGEAAAVGVRRRGKTRASLLFFWGLLFLGA